VWANGLVEAAAILIEDEIIPRALTAAAKPYLLREDARIKIQVHPRRLTRRVRLWPGFAPATQVRRSRPRASERRGCLRGRGDNRPPR
jgi:hypothetical protein